MEEIKFMWEQMIEHSHEILPAVSQFLFFVMISCISIVRQRKRYEKIINKLELELKRKQFDNDLKVRTTNGQKREEGNT